LKGVPTGFETVSLGARDDDPWVIAAIKERIDEAMGRTGGDDDGGAAV
jgi:hypothetical protein